VNLDTIQTLTQQRNDLKEKVFSHLSTSENQELKKLLYELNTPVDSALNSLLEELFQRTPRGRKEALRMEVDILRRVSRCRETEQIFRAFGVLILATPVRVNGKAIHAIISGPIKVNAWTHTEKQTLAKLCDLSPTQMPEALDQSILYNNQQVQVLVRQQSQTAHLIELLLRADPEAATASHANVSSIAGIDLLQPGFAQHLDMLFSTIQRELRDPKELSLFGRKRMQLATKRGRHLVDLIQRRSADTLAARETLSVHAELKRWADHISRLEPTLRINLKLEAEQDQLHTNPQRLQHLLFTLMAGVADGLPEAKAIMGVSTRIEEKGQEKYLHIELRDGGGLATFAGIENTVEQQLLSEHNLAAEEFSDWISLATHLEAELKIRRDEGVVTRIELFLPLDTTPDALDSGTASGIHQIWIVEDDDREFETLVRMLTPTRLVCTRFTSAAEIREKFTLSPRPPDMVLLKYHLPDQRGAEVRSWLYEQDADLPVILISSFQATHPGIATANSLPSTLYLQKPFDSRDLIDMIKMNLDDTLPGCG
jgi:CheY-like chemotaxis protein